MMRSISIALSVFVCGIAYVGTSLVHGLAQSSPITGQWNLSGPIVRNGIQLTIQRSVGSHSSMSSGSVVPVNQLRGLTRNQIESQGTTAKFQLVREAGSFYFEGFLKAGGGGGNFTFTPDAKFIAEMRVLGYATLSDEAVFRLALHDITTGYARDLRALGLKIATVDQLITLRIHDVTPEYVRAFQDLGFSDLTPDMLTTMRIHGVTPEFARELKAMSYSPTPDQMVTMRIHQVSTDFMKEITMLGLGKPSIEQLVTMRIHGVTPEIIRKAQAHGMRNASIDQLVSLRIRGVL